jgi:arabinan endo-1,5-alpha-L-arabinosidase
MKSSDIQIRDPFIVPMEAEGKYYLFGSTDTNIWDPSATGFDCYKSADLQDWEGPIPAFRPSDGFWSDRNYWAPEVHAYKGSFYMFASFKAERRFRGTQLLKSDRIEGPYQPLSDRPVTPANWECLDGTLHVDPVGTPWIVFCHEWVQVHDGEMQVLQLTQDLKSAVGRPHFLFNASEPEWAGPSANWPEKPTDRWFPCYVTDGPFLYTADNGELLMLWSSYGSKGYAMGTARSETGKITGPWIQDKEALWDEDGGHGMIFKTFEGQLMLTFHTPNQSPNERPVFMPLKDEDGRLTVVK